MCLILDSVVICVKASTQTNTCDLLHRAYDLMLDTLQHLEDECMKTKFARDSRLGFITLSPGDIGTGMRIKIVLELEAMQMPDLLPMCKEHFMEVRQLQKKNRYQYRM